MLYFNLIHFQENIYVNPNQYYWSCCWRLHVALFAILWVYSIWFVENILDCKSLYCLEYVSFHAMRIFSTIVKHLVLNVIRLSGNKETRDILANTWIGVLIVPIFKKVLKLTLRILLSQHHNHQKPLGFSYVQPWNSRSFSISALRPPKPFNFLNVNSGYLIHH